MVVFFVLSGYLVGGKAAAETESGAFSLQRYLVDRATRIYVVLAPALALTFALDTLGRGWLADGDVYDPAFFIGRDGAGVFLANLANLQNIAAPAYGTNSPLWSLAHEFWYYVTFGLALAALSRARPFFFRALCGAGALVLLIALSAPGGYHLFGFLLWLTGVMAARIADTPATSRRGALAIFLLALLLPGLLSAHGHWIERLTDALIALSFAHLLVSVRRDARKLPALCEFRLHARLSEFSYSLYATHLPVIVFACALSQRVAGAGWRQQTETPAQWLAAGAVAAISVGVSYLFHLRFERRTGALRAWANERLARRRLRETVAG